MPSDLGDYADIEWSVAVDVCVGVMVRQHADHRWQAVYNALLGWITDGLHSQHQEQVGSLQSLYEIVSLWCTVLGWLSR